MNLATEVKQDLWAAVSRSYESQLWSNAIMDAVHFLSESIRSRTGLESDGTALAGQALGGKVPKLRLNRMETETEKNVQSGVESLLRGLYQSIRNPRSHGRLEDSREDADALILFVGYLLRVLGQAKDAFSVDECVTRILEDNFLPNSRYVELLIAEIPPRQRLQVSLAVFRRKTELRGTRQRVFFAALLATLHVNDQSAVCEAISTELRASREESELRATLQLLDPSQWLRLDEVARLRTENRLMRDLAEGSFNRAEGSCTKGALATWSRAYWPLFTLKAEVLSVLISKLSSSSVDSRDYVLEFCWDSMGALYDKPPKALQRVVVERLNAGDQRFHDTMKDAMSLLDDDWGEEVDNAWQSFMPQQDPPSEDDDLPF